MRNSLFGVAFAVTLTLGLAGCSNADPEAQLRSDVSEVIAAGNSEDTAELRGKAQELLSTISALGGSGQITSAREAQLRELTLAVLRGADQLEVLPSAPASPTPSPSPSPTPPPSPTPSPSPSPTPPPSPSASPTPKDDKGEPTPEPSKPGKSPKGSPSPVIELSVAPSPTAS